ncbi:tyrosine-protein phosphatase non-receptor type 1-like isoform X2 [Lampris incognitus]|uniref:tyrosine-protein phosphatase non-receptor type 1-like isoform X2 n=1 Tax=Lampris incognitus TaxID=2546036 RepID=UPI0024B61EAB|nr:tyrosine-protein phosphatase non-receptor type 1-like isoform X2 [Lampris incognitus]
MKTGVGAPFTRKSVSSRLNCLARSPNYLKTRVGIVTEMSARGPLPSTCGHFWEMVWEQRTRGVVMLNRVIEKGSVKCAQYWPQREEGDAMFEDTDFKLVFVSEDVKSDFTICQLELTNLSTQETREILHFNYTTWPDFGVPESPASFLNFLFKVRESGCLNSDQGPVVVHCSAGIGRSGTFCLVDTCLLLMSTRRDPSSVRIRDVLLEMRRYRMGLIQTADQLRFSYLAVTEGAKRIAVDASLQESQNELSSEEDVPPEFAPPPRPARDAHNGKAEPPFFPENDVIRQKDTHALRSSLEPEVRRRNIADAQTVTESVDQPDFPMGTQEYTSKALTKPQQQHVTEEPAISQSTEQSGGNDSTPGPWSPLLTNVCLCTALALGAYVCYRTCFH